MSVADGAAYLSIANDQGVTPCAVFNASWGHWISQLPNDVPTCADQGLAVAVMCLNGSAQWSAENVKNLQFEQNGPGGSPLMQFDLTQDGICAVFPAGGSQ